MKKIILFLCFSIAIGALIPERKHTYKTEPVNNQRCCNLKTKEDVKNYLLIKLDDEKKRYPLHLTTKSDEFRFVCKCSGAYTGHYGFTCGADRCSCVSTRYSPFDKNCLCHLNDDWKDIFIKECLDEILLEMFDGIEVMDSYMEDDKVREHIKYYQSLKGVKCLAH